MSHDIGTGDCNQCGFWRARSNRKKGVLIPGGYGKCTRPEGHCVPDYVKGDGIDNPNFKARQMQEIRQQIKQENEEMAKNAAPVIDPEVVDCPTEIERDGQGRIVVDYDSVDDAPPGFVKPLSKAEKERRAELEEVVTRNFRAFYEVGCALRIIQQEMLHRTTHDRFSDYCRDLWDMARSRAYQLIESADVVDNLKVLAPAYVQNFGHASKEKASEIPYPRNDVQARSLARFKPEEQVIVWSEAVKTAPKGKITASHIKKTARRLHLEKVKETITKEKKKTNQAPRISEEFRKAFNGFMDAINVERAAEYKNTDKDEVIKSVRVVLHALEAEL